MDKVPSQSHGKAQTMFNLLVKGNGWADGGDNFPVDRVLEYTDAVLVDQFRPGGKVDFDKLVGLPTVFLEETAGRAADSVARVGSIVSARTSGSNVAMKYYYDSTLRAFTNEDFEILAVELGIDKFEFHRTHWAVKSADLYRALIRRLEPRHLKPKVFTLDDPERLDATLVSVMMPFDTKFDAIYAALRESAEHAKLRCLRADDIWKAPNVIQDVVSLIDRSRIVICDCTSRNSNVFYEIGIAHTLGREVILITQSENDVPFDLKHLRFVKYSNDVNGHVTLKKRIKSRLADLVAA